jgi:hypothetical protein
MSWNGLHWKRLHHELERAALAAIASSAGTGCTGSDCIISWNGLHWQRLLRFVNLKYRLHHALFVLKSFAASAGALAWDLLEQSP